MRTAELLCSIASWLESPNNEALLLSEADENCAQIVAESCVLAARLLRTAADEVDSMEPPDESLITAEAIDDMANLASALDSSGDIQLKKQASVLDELLLTIAAPPNALAIRKDLQDNRLEELRKKYEEPREELMKVNKMADTEKAIEKSKMTKQFAINEHPLSTRYCPDHHGQMTYRVGEHLVQCPLDKKVYSFENGYTLNNGEKVPGGDVSLQTQNVSVPYHALFDTRQGRLDSNQP